MVISQNRFYHNLQLYFPPQTENISTRHWTPKLHSFSHNSWMQKLFWSCGHRKFLSSISGLVKEFETRFKDFSEIEKLSQFLKTPYNVLPEKEWTDVTEKVFKLSTSKLQMEIIDLQEDVSSKAYRNVINWRILG